VDMFLVRLISFDGYLQFWISIDIFIGVFHVKLDATNRKRNDHNGKLSRGIGTRINPKLYGASSSS
jgi:hypothetical protein